MDAPRNDGNASMPEQVKRPNPWRKLMMMMMMMVNLENKTRYQSSNTYAELQTRQDAVLLKIQLFWGLNLSHFVSRFRCVEGSTIPRNVTKCSPQDTTSDWTPLHHPVPANKHKIQ
jgi:hypothetical protein